MTPGLGVVAENGPGATKFAVGQRVVGVPFSGSGQGSFQQYVALPESLLVRGMHSLSSSSTAMDVLLVADAVTPHTPLGFPDGELLTMVPVVALED